MGARAFRSGCHTSSVAPPAGASCTTATPCGFDFAANGVSVTKMKAIMLSWMLQPSETAPGLSNVMLRVSSRP